jgi:hypothetical protein
LAEGSFGIVRKVQTNVAGDVYIDGNLDPLIANSIAPGRRLSHSSQTI